MCLQQGSGLEIDDTKFKQGFNVHMNSGLFIYDGTGCGAVLIFGVWFSGKGEWEKRVLRHRQGLSQTSSSNRMFDMAMPGLRGN